MRRLCAPSPPAHTAFGPAEGSAASLREGVRVRMGGLVQASALATRAYVNSGHPLVACVGVTASPAGKTSLTLVGVAPI